MVRVRFAPSPTGYLHIGSARTALFNWLYARRQGGIFILRIEDTDKERSKKEYLEEILEDLKWLGLNWDEGPIFQSERIAVYREYAEKLLREGKAYREGEAIIFKVAGGTEIHIDDEVHGRIKFESETIKDQVLIKSDALPAYNFACVVDDSLMGVTHIIRGDDHISNTPKQILLYNALGFKVPKFAHIPLILGEDRSRMSKRHGATAISEYRKQGFLPEALVNYLALLGWSPGGDREILPLDEITKLFDVEDVNKTGAVFDMDKLNWLNGQYIKNMNPSDLVAHTLDFLKAKGVVSDRFDDKLWIGIVKAYRERTRTLEDFVGVYKIFFNDEIEYEEKAVKDYLKKPNSRDIIRRCKTGLEGLSKFDKVCIEESYRKLAGELKLKAAELIHPTRVAISGKTVGAGLFEMMELLGREKVLKRLEKFC